jgi:hypothetical protein
MDRGCFRKCATRENCLRPPESPRRAPGRSLKGQDKGSIIEQTGFTPDALRQGPRVRAFGRRPGFPAPSSAAGNRMAAAVDRGPFPGGSPLGARRRRRMSLAPFASGARVTLRGGRAFAVVRTTNPRTLTPFFGIRAYSSTVRAEDSSARCRRRVIAGGIRGNSENPSPQVRHGNAEPSQGYSSGRCRD